MKNVDPQSGGQIEAGKCVTREQWYVDGLTTITPAMGFFEQWKEGVQAFVLQLSGYLSLKAVSGLNRIPLL
jgi:hypothetical protein